MTLTVALLCILGVALLVIGCQQLGTTTVAEVAVAEVIQQVADVPQAVLPTATVADVLLDEATAEPVVDTCTACHTDKEQLIAVADPIEELVEENEGAG
jgi:hypothetical protein